MEMHKKNIKVTTKKLYKTSTPIAKQASIKSQVLAIVPQRSSKRIPTQRLAIQTILPLAEDTVDADAKRISDLQLASSLDDFDLIPVVDRSDYTMGMSGTTKGAQISLLVTTLISLLDNSYYISGPIYSTSTTSEESIAELEVDLEKVPVGKLIKVTAFGTFASNSASKKVILNVNGTNILDNNINTNPNGQSWSLESSILRYGTTSYSYCGNIKIGTSQEYVQNGNITSSTDPISITIRSLSDAAAANQLILTAFHVAVQ